MTLDITTANGDPAYSSTGAACLDFFSSAGSLRGSRTQAEVLFRAAYAEDTDLAIRALLWLRDREKGAGERQLTRDLLKVLVSELRPEIPDARKFLSALVQLGRFDDLLTIVEIDSPLRHEVLECLLEEISSGNRLAAKWMPREGKKGDALAKVLRRAWGMNPKQYRQFLVSATHVVESQMCAQEWGEIAYKAVPSRAMQVYKKAYDRQDNVRFQAFLEAVKAGKETMRVSGVYPHEIVHRVGKDEYPGDMGDLSWAALPNYIPEGSRVLALADVSGSMSTPVPGSTVTCMTVSVALALYTAERLTGAYHNLFITFHESPAILKIRDGKIKDKIDYVKGTPWGRSTNLDGAFEEILRVAVEFNVPADQMPTTLLILSDMQFDAISQRSIWDHMFGTRRQTNKSGSAYQRALASFEAAGYKVPNIVFWNLNARAGTSPVTEHEPGVALVSGFNPAILETVLGGREYNPTQIMRDTLMQDRYQWR